VAALHACSLHIAWHGVSKSPSCYILKLLSPNSLHTCRVLCRTHVVEPPLQSRPATDWLGSFFQHTEARFQRAHGFWVEQAKPPEDYIYENLSYDRFSRFCRLVRLFTGERPGGGSVSLGPKETAQPVSMPAGQPAAPRTALSRWDTSAHMRADNPANCVVNPVAS
jgi:hypothetical protein